MAYQENTTVASPDVLIDTLMTFCATAGWTVLRNTVAGSSRTATLHKPGVTDYIHVYNLDAAYVRMRISIGYDDALPVEQQPNVSGESRTLLNAGAYPKAFMFASQDQVWVAVGIAASGEYRHFTFGRLEKAGAYTGGTYADGTVWPGGNYHATWTQNHYPFQADYQSNTSYGYLRVDVPDDGKANNFFLLGRTTSGNTHEAAYGEAGANGRAARLALNADDNAFSGRSILHTIPVFVGRTGSQLYYSPAGVVQDVRICSLNKFEPEQEVPIAGDLWKVFPIVAKRAMNTAQGVQPAASGDYGFAIKKVA